MTETQVCPIPNTVCQIELNNEKEATVHSVFSICVYKWFKYRQHNLFSPSKFTWTRTTLEFTPGEPRGICLSFSLPSLLPSFQLPFLPSFFCFCFFLFVFTFAYSIYFPVLKCKDAVKLMCTPPWVFFFFWLFFLVIF